MIKDAGSDAHISLKLTQQGLDIDAEYCYQNVRQIIQKAQSFGVFVRVDMEGTAHPAHARPLLPPRQEFDNVGIVIQAYLHRSEKDVRDLNKVGAKVRLCKGAYKEPKDLAIQRMEEDIRANYLRAGRQPLPRGRLSGHRHPRLQADRPGQGLRRRPRHTPRQLRVPVPLRHPEQVLPEAGGGGLPRPLLCPLRDPLAARTT